jgi:charged multivesicular body protein 4
MSGWMSYFTGRKATTESARDAIVGLRQQLLMLEKKEEHLMKKIEEEEKKARANATSNKRCTLTPGLLRMAHLPPFPSNRSFPGSFGGVHLISMRSVLDC